MVFPQPRTGLSNASLGVIGNRSKTWVCRISKCDRHALFGRHRDMKFKLTQNEIEDVHRRQVCLCPGCSIMATAEVVVIMDGGKDYRQIVPGQAMFGQQLVEFPERCRGFVSEARTDQGMKLAYQSADLGRRQGHRSPPEPGGDTPPHLSEIKALDRISADTETSHSPRLKTMRAHRRGRTKILKWR